MTRCVVTGGAGVIGRELVAMVRARGDDVHVVDRLPRPTAFDDEVTYVQGDLVELDASAITVADPEVIYHLAAASERSTENPEFWRQNAHDNVAASQRVLAAACAASSLRRYVFASSYLVYDPDLFLVAEPPDAVVELTEDSLIDPRNPCGAAKLLHEKEAHLAAEAEDQGFTVVSARIYRVYGQNSHDVVSRWIRAALNDEAVTLFGQESFFDYIHARDVAQGLMRLADTDAEGPVNLGSGRSERVATMVENIVRHFPEFQIDGPHPAESYEASQAGIARLEALTGWRPRISLEEGVAELVGRERANVEAGAVSRRVLEPEVAHVLISSVSRKAPLVRAVRQGLESMLMEGSVGGADLDPDVSTRGLLDWFWHMGRLDAMTDADLVSGCAGRDVTLLIPTRDGELERYASLRDDLAAVGTFVPIGSVQSVRACLDKVETAEVCLANELPAIDTATSIDDVDGARLVVKDRRGAGSRRVVLDVDRRSAQDAAATMAEPVFQPYVAGPEFSVDVYVRVDGTVVASMVRRRRLVIGGEAQVTESVHRPDIDELARGAVLAFGVRGHAVVQVVDGAAGPCLVEVNSRVGGATAAGIAGGVRSIDYMLAESRGEAPTPITIHGLHIELTRLPADIVRFR